MEQVIIELEKEIERMKRVINSCQLRKTTKAEKEALIGCQAKIEAFQDAIKLCRSAK